MIAIYARKSVFKEDSISIESQIEMCEYEARGEDYLIYKDNGFSGKNTDRPDFQRMMNDIKIGKIHKVIVYRLDRVSRSVLDFSEMMQIFQKYQVDFISATEHFDTSSPMGRAMLNICIVFAQLERETIQQRIIDAHASRSKKGLFMGGKIPYGYEKVPTTIKGIKTSMYKPKADESEDIRLIYQIYSQPTASFGDVIKALQDKGLLRKRNGNCWNATRISHIVRNPVYAVADMNMYYFFKEQKTNIINPPEEFNGQSSFYLFAGENPSRKTWDLSGQNIVIAPHQGLIDSETWIKCRKKILANHEVKFCKPKNSFLAGKVKCGHCGYGLTVRVSNRSSHLRSFIDTGKYVNKICSYKLPVIHADDLETMIIDKIEEKIDKLCIKPKKEIKIVNHQITDLENKIETVNHEVEMLMNNLMSQKIESTTMNYINKKISELDEQKKKYLEQIERIRYVDINKNKINYSELKNVMSKWDSLSFDDKRNVIELLITKIVVYCDKIDIIWKV